VYRPAYSDLAAKLISQNSDSLKQDLVSFLVSVEHSVLLVWLVKDVQKN